MEGDGTVREEVEGSPRITLADGSEFVVTPDSLEAPDGTRFGIDTEAGQDEEDAPLLVRTTILRLPRNVSTMEERVASYVEEHPEVAEPEARAAIEASDSGTTDVSTTVEDQLADWLADAEEDERAQVVVALRGEPPLTVPPVADYLTENDPVAALDALEERILAIEARKTQMSALQADFVAEMEGTGARIVGGEWLLHVVELEAGVDTIRSLIDDPRVLRVELAHSPEADANDGIEVREATQVDQLLDAGFDGTHPSGMASYDRIHGVVIDADMDEDHPAFQDDSSGTASRLITLWRYTTFLGVTTWWDALAYGWTSTTSSTSHGQAVAATFAGDLTDGQDPSITTPWVQSRRSGNCLECTFDFVESGGGAPVNSSWGKAGDRSPDVIVRSESCGSCTPCDTDYTENAAVDALYLLDAFVVNTPGNQSHGSGCSVRSPATAAGSFTPNCYEHVGVSDLNTAPICSTASEGGDVHGRALIDLIATGRETPALPSFDDSYGFGPTWGSSSAAAPTIGGAVAILKDFLVTEIDAVVFNEVGNLYATMLLMGDGTLTSGSAGATSAPDDVWGVGRMRMRLFNEEGMDAPWRARWCQRLLEPGDVGSCDAHPAPGGSNQNLPLGVDRLRAALWWFEPNVGSTETPATIAFRSRRDGAVNLTASGGPQVKRIRAASDLAGSKWVLEAVGTTIPASTHATYFPGAQKRTVYIALYWEDEARDDTDGPGNSIQ